MDNLFGVMQGRLLPKYKGRFQAHPVDYWEDEFGIAKTCNLACIEFIFDHHSANSNPLVTPHGIEQIINVEKRSGVRVQTICADYFMEFPFFSTETPIVEENYKLLGLLLKAASCLGVTDIVIPCVDNSSILKKSDEFQLEGNILPILVELEAANVAISLETDLPPARVAHLLERINSAKVKVNYDIGNSASLGYDPVEELDAYGECISNIHIKDRKFNGPTVFLGEGDADFSRFFDKLAKLNYGGPFIMQAYRDEEGLSVFKQQANWIKRYL